MGKESICSRCIHRDVCKIHAEESTDIISISACSGFLDVSMVDKKFEPILKNLRKLEEKIGKLEKAVETLDTIRILLLECIRQLKALVTPVPVEEQ